ncbi:MAG: hypothetical protein AAF657_22355 [Acidobacteriota bacterium]
MLAQTPGAFDLLDQIRSAYGALETYGDLGEIEHTETDASGEHTRLSFFEAALDPAGRFLWRSHGESPAGDFEEHAMWNDGQQTFVYRSAYDQYRQVPSLAAELAHGGMLGGYDALVVPLLLIGHDEVLADPEGAAVDGPEPCGDASCWVLSLSRMRGTLETELLIDRQSSLIRQVVVRRREARSNKTGQSTDATTVIRVSHHPSFSGSPVFEPPASARRVAAWEPTNDASEAPSGDGQNQPAEPVFQEEITVALFSVVARIVDNHGSPILGLEPGDVVARVGRQAVPIVDLEWTSSYASGAEIPAADLEEARQLALAGDLTMTEVLDQPVGRSVVVFLQIDLIASRVKGHLKILPEVEKLFESLHPDDRVAIVSFDSHLKLWQDFTTDRSTAFTTLKQAIGYGTPQPQRSSGVSLYEHFDFRAAKDVATPERALHVTAEALQGIPGEKDLVYLGWGLGRYGVGGVRMTGEFAPAVRALRAARATVFVLDVSQADYHSLEVGLQNVAAETGGTYSQTFHFAAQAVRRLARTIGGHYVIHLDRSALPDLRGDLILELAAQKGSVLSQPIVLR